MAVEQLSEHLWQFAPGPFDVHAHPRVFDAKTQDDFVLINEGTEGKAGLRIYTETALRSGIVGIAAMPNESIRLYDAGNSEKTEEKPYPIASLDRVLPMQAAIEDRAVIPTAIHMGLDPKKAFWDQDKQRLKRQSLSREFNRVHGECIGLKVYLAETTGGNNIAVEHGAQVADIWHHANPDKPVIFHVEGGDVMKLFEDIYKLDKGKDIPVHIAHVSSEQEMRAVIAAKESGMNVTCEVTPHHLFLDETIQEKIGGYGCMKPGLKSRQDIDFLWANMKHIDIFASDCAPHRISDKEKEQPAFGVTNHTVMLPLLLGAVQDGRLTMEDIDWKFCVAPRQRFNLPLEDQSLVKVHLEDEVDTATLEAKVMPHYGQNPFVKLGGVAIMRGEVVGAQAGLSALGAPRTSYTHLIRPKNIGLK
jgi:carbamoyl-phosphate synthase/aspartate carbamoyltransferase/dihydroorotase